MSEVPETKTEEVAPLVSTSAEAVAADLARRIPVLKGVPEVEVIAALVALNTTFPQGFEWIIDDRETVMAMIQASPKGWDDVAIGTACKQVLDAVDTAEKEIASRFAEEVGGVEPGTDYETYTARLKGELKEQGDLRALVAEVQTALSRAIVTLEIPLEEVKALEKPSGWAARFRSTAQVIAIRAGHAFYIPPIEEEEVPVIERPGWQTEPILRKEDPELRQLWVVTKMIETKMGKQAILTRLAALGLGIENLKDLLQNLANKARLQEEQCRAIEERASSEFTTFKKALTDIEFVRQLAFRVTDFIFPETAPTPAKS